MALRTLGWTATPTPVTPLDALATELGLGWLGIKRDDACRPTSGGSKVRKLDVLLASEPWLSAARWVSVGAIGSGHVLCCAQAAKELGKAFHGHLFWEDLCPTVLANLAVTATQSTGLSYHRSRLSLALTAPHVLWANGARGVIPAGGTTVAGTLGMVRGGLELAAQVRAGAVAEPDVLFVAHGTGGSAAGLSLGVQLGGLATQVVAVGTVERMLAPDWALRRLIRRVAAQIRLADLPVDVATATPQILRAWVGRGYGDASPESVAACGRLLTHDAYLEPVYTGKAMAALLALAPQLRGKNVLFWGTAHGELPAVDPRWRDRLPARLRRRLARAQRPTNPRRRRLLLATSAAVALAGGGYRLLGYTDVPTWRGRVLSAREVRIVMALGEALLPVQAQTEAHLLLVAQGVDRYLSGLPSKLQLLSRAALGAVEQATPLGRMAQRMTRQSAPDRRTLLVRLHELGGPLAEAARGARDLVLVGWYQQPAAWPAIGYEGPQVSASPRPIAAKYAALIAPAGALPKAAGRPERSRP